MARAAITIAPNVNFVTKLHLQLVLPGTSGDGEEAAARRDESEER
jgi:hypothetical protein